jgi:glycosyltransferase involved in cell wall biosynthesis
MKPQFTFVSPATFEHWDWLNPDEPGIGGSETSHVYMAQGLARRGCDVASFAPCSYLGPMHDPAGVPWRWWDLAFNRQDALYAGDRGGVWVIYRDPAVLDLVPPGVPAWVICQDVDYDSWTPERIARATRIVALCHEQRRFLLHRHSEMSGKIAVSSNGVREDIIADALAEGLPRDPKRLIYPSSPDRGLLNLVPIFERAREMDPQLELHVYYGFDNIEKVVAAERAKLGRDDGPVATSTRKIREAINKPGIVLHGRTGQRALAREWAQSGIWCHPSNFQETSCITCMDAQALGAIPITNPIWAAGENVRHGVFIEGNAVDYVTAGLYAIELVKLANDPARQEKIRSVMMQDALNEFRWENFVGQWEDWADQDLAAIAAKQQEAACAV